MNILNFGSCCIDHVYSVPHFAGPGETLASTDQQIYPGGKGLNQSLALSYAGASVCHAGKVGTDGRFLKDLLDAGGVDTSLLQVTDSPSGHAIIQVVPSGENAIVLSGGTNQAITHDDVDAALNVWRTANTDAGAGFLLLQNETSSLDYMIQQAAGAGMRIIFNAAPMTGQVLSLPLELIELLIINEVEGTTLTGANSTEHIAPVLLKQFPGMKILLTLGREGALYADGHETIRAAARAVTVVDTTGAGDTFTGYFVAGYISGEPVDQCLARAISAAAICVTRPGAASSIPAREDL